MVRVFITIEKGRSRWNVMEVLKNIRVYPLSNFITSSKTYIKLPNELRNLTTKEQEDQLGFLHIIENDFKPSALLQKLVDYTADEGKILIIDIVSLWSQQKQRQPGAIYMNSLSCINITGLIAFLELLYDSPMDALRRCQVDRFDFQLRGIVIDNLSFLNFENDNNYNVINLSKFEKLFKILRKLREFLGCWIITKSFPMEFYNGIENSLVDKWSIKRKGGVAQYPTRLPESYMKGMDLVVCKEVANGKAQYARVGAVEK
ncbi:PSY3-like protein [Saccharomyces kudriavzevii IFO 1802]|uniref:PSY3-like protein n=2 Tax=Saccharomyces kudriavzevii (strain ATCC MYA-4449 / AS 2.2408 / CBS 8840 / NBRC 1802 / NCYC 2889) TaxID=226230 RepID=J4U1Z8_SACK1|nr:PSY3-like protein [Saccharomyces kudriavzevii IFO 1802]